MVQRPLRAARRLAAFNCGRERNRIIRRGSGRDRAETGAEHQRRRHVHRRGDGGEALGPRHHRHRRSRQGRQRVQREHQLLRQLRLHDSRNRLPGYGARVSQYRQRQHRRDADPLRSDDCRGHSGSGACRGAEGTPGDAVWSELHRGSH